MNGQEMPIFTRIFDFLSWLLPMTDHFPRAQRHTFTRRLLDAAFDLHTTSAGRSGPCPRQRYDPAQQ